MQLIDIYRHMERREILDCRIKSMKELVRHYGLNLSSYEVMLLSEAFTFNYTKVRIPGVSLESLPYATASHNKLETTFFNKLNIHYQEEKIAGSDENWERMKGMIDQGTPILFKIDSRFMKETDDAAPKQLKLNLYYLSTLLLVGYDEEKGVALIVLTNDDEKESVNEITIEEFQKYRCSICAPFSPEGLCFYLNSDHGIGKISSEQMNKALYSSLVKTAETMLNSGENYSLELGSFVGSEVKKGIFGMRNLSADLQMMAEQLKFEHNPLIVRLLMVFIRNNLMFGSYSAFREEFGRCLKHCATKFGIDELFDIGNGFVGTAQSWKTFFTLLSRIAHNNGDLNEQAYMVVQVWDTIIQLELELFTRVRNTLSATTR